MRPKDQWRRRATLVAGTRPELIKLNPVAHALAARGWQVHVLHSGQHFSDSMRDVFLRELDWPCKIVQVDLGGRTALDAMAQMLTRLPTELKRLPGIVIVQGDTNSTLAAALVANRLAFPLAHVEAGLRSWDLRMPEEHNRRLVDHIADLLYAPTEDDALNLRSEAVWGDIAVTGNTAIDSVRRYASRAVSSTLGDDYILVTLHRAENVDDPGFLEHVMDALLSMDCDSVFPVHPRTRARLKETAIGKRVEAARHVHLVDPLGYFDFLGAMIGARVLLTDSGGIVEEATAPEIRKPVVVVRASTERMVAITAGFATLVSAEPGAIRKAMTDLSWFHPAHDSPFGLGDTAVKISEHLEGWSA